MPGASRSPRGVIVLALLLATAWARADLLTYRQLILAAHTLLATPAPVDHAGTVRIWQPFRATAQGPTVLAGRGVGPALTLTWLGHRARSRRCQGLRVVAADGHAVLFTTDGARFAAIPDGGFPGTVAAPLGSPGQRGGRFVHLWVRVVGRVPIVYGLWDSAYATGAFRFRIRNGPAVVMAVRATLFLRRPVTALGLAPLMSMYDYGTANPIPATALYPAVHDADGLLVERTTKTYLWRPLANPRTIQTSTVARYRVCAFGLMQRDRHFLSYQSVQGHYQDRPSVWVNLDDLGGGHIRLEQRPGNGIGTNVFVWWSPPYWPKPGRGWTYTYRLSWQVGYPRRSVDGRVISTLIGGDAPTGAIKYVIDYAGGALGDPLPAPVRGVVVVHPDTWITQDTVKRNRYTDGYRQIIQVLPVAGQRIAIRAWLMAGRWPLSEIWEYVVPKP
ncbi:MAG: glucan biosynthesis protein [Acidiferrobacter sp.]